MVERIYLVIELVTIFYMLHLMFGKIFCLDIITVIFFSIDIVILEMINTKVIPEWSSIVMYIITFIYLLLHFSNPLLSTLKKYVLGILIVSLLQLGVGLGVYALIGDLSSEKMTAVIINTIVLLILVIATYAVDRDKARQLIIWFKEHKLFAVTFVGLLVVEVMVFKINGQIEFAHGASVFVLTILFVVELSLWQNERVEIKKENKELQTKSFYQETYSEMIRDIRRKQHDFDNHLNAVTGMNMLIDSKEDVIDKQDEYVKKIISENKFNKIVNDKASPVITGFLYKKFTEAEIKGVEIYPHIVIESAACNIPEYEIVEILGILLDNAIEAVDNLAHKEVVCEMVEYSEKVVVSVRNTYPVIPRDELARLFEEGFSTKGANRGIGLSKVKDIVSKYSGEIMVESLEIEEKNWFSITIEINKG